MEICHDIGGWDEDTELLVRQLEEILHPQQERLDKIEKDRQAYRKKLRKQIRKLGGTPVL